MTDEPTNPAMQARLAKLFSQLAIDLRKKNQKLYPKRMFVAPLAAPIPDAPKPFVPVLSDEAKAIFKKATNPPETLEDVKECLR